MGYESKAKEITGGYECLECKAQFTGRNAWGSFCLHYYNKHVKPLRKGETKQEGKPGRKRETAPAARVETCPECSAALRLLTEANEQERFAIAQGYTKVCPKCWEVV